MNGYYLGKVYEEEYRTSLFNQARKAFEKKNYKKARKLYNQVEDIRTSWTTRYNLGTLYWNIGKYASSTDCYTSSLIYNPPKNEIEDINKMITKATKKRDEARAQNAAIWGSVLSGVASGVKSGLSSAGSSSNKKSTTSTSSSSSSSSSSSKSSSSSQGHTVEEHKTCGARHGSGRLGDKKCPSCKGNGYHVHYEYVH